MAGAGTTKVVLVTPGGLRKSFGIEHAERLLRLGSYANGGWEIEKGQNYYYTEENGIRYRKDKGHTTKTGEQPDAE